MASFLDGGEVITSIRVSNMPPHITESEFNCWFLFAHGFEQATLAPSKTPGGQQAGWARFATVEAAQQAVQYLSGLQLSLDMSRCVPTKLAAEMARKNFKVRHPSSGSTGQNMPQEEIWHGQANVIVIKNSNFSVLVMCECWSPAMHVDRDATCDMAEDAGATRYAPSVDQGQSGSLSTASQTSEAALPDQRVMTMELNYAAGDGDASLVKKLLEARHDPSAGDYHDGTPLHVAAGSGKGHEVMRLLIAARAGVNVLDKGGDTPLQLARFKKDWEAENILVQNGAKNMKQRIQQEAQHAHWLVDRSEVHVGEELSHTLKSKVSLATWCGTTVVAKVALPSVTMNRMASNLKISKSLLDMAADESEAEDVALQDELLQEIDILSSIRHPDLVMFLGACLEKDAPIMFITEYMSGGDLEHYYMAKRKHHNGDPWHADSVTVTGWATAIARALSFLHNCHPPIIHRDLKPLNLLLNKNLDLKVVDFGISKMMNEGGKAADRYKMTGGIGSLLYMAPEVVRYQDYSEKVDIYSFALIMYFMSSGRTPFYEMGRDPELVLKEYLKGNEPRPKVKQCQVHLRKIISQAWSVDAKDRPSGQELTAMLVEASHSAEVGCACSVM
ncbi:unnamed protein product [Polarella glacialis]|uniref:Protein kinase domain-containing protein n=1 Tax=Polarella glacialis TaxID=89957 RepID=A0A813H2Q5_POLGL|nr:unnamed protein product [Polarella glacialis]